MIYFLDNSLQLQKIVTSKNVISAIHEHELNGLIRADVELDLSYANKFLILGIDHVGYYYKDEFYLHKIQRVEYDHVNETATVVLRHIFFEDMIFGKLIQDVRPQNQDALAVSKLTIDANTRWQTIMTDVTGQLSTNFYWQVPYEVIEFMTKNYRIEYLPKILFDGHKINGFQLHLANKIGEDKNIRIPYGSRVLDLKYEEDYSEIITKLVVHGKGEEVGDGYGRRINISDVNFNRNGVKSPVGSLYLEDETITNMYGNDGQTPREGREVFEDIEDANELAEAGYQHYLQVSRPQMLFTADVADIGDVGIGDSVMIIRREYDVYFNARIHKLSVDLLYPEDAQVELGDYEHFKESRVERKTREKNNRVQGQLSDRITQLKLEANERFDNEVEQLKSEFDQALIDAEAQVEAKMEAHKELWEQKNAEIDDDIRKIIGGDVSVLDTNIIDMRNELSEEIQKTEGIKTSVSSLINTSEENSSTLGTMKSDLGVIQQDVSTVKQTASGLRQEVTALDKDVGSLQSWRSEKGSLYDQTAESVRIKAWKSDIDAVNIGINNLIPLSDIVNWESASVPAEWRKPWGAGEVWSGRQNSKYILVRSNYDSIKKGTSFGVCTPYLTEDLVEGETYTLGFNTFSWTNTVFDYMYIMYDNHPNQNLATPKHDRYTYGWSDNGAKNVSYQTLTFTPNKSGKARILFAKRIEEGEQTMFYINEPMLVKGNKLPVDFMPSQDDFVQQTDFVIKSDGFLLGTKKMGGDKFASAIVGNSTGLKLIGDSIDVTGNLNVQKSVKAWSLESVTANISSIRSDILKSNVVLSEHLKVDSALANKFNANSAFISRLEVKAANITDLTATHIRGGLLESLNGSYSQNMITGNTHYYTNANINFHSQYNQLRMTNGTRTGGIYMRDEGLEKVKAHFGVSDGNFIDENSTSWTGMISDGETRSTLLSGNYIIFSANGYTRRYENASWRMDTASRGDGTNRYFYGNDSGKYNYILGHMNNKLSNIFTQYVGTSSDPVERLTTNHINALRFTTINGYPAIIWGATGIQFRSKDGVYLISSTGSYISKI